MPWHEGPLVGFDLETTGTDPQHARIVTAAVVHTHGGQVTDRRLWLADPGIAIPDEAAAIHGITSERARTQGRPAPDVVEEVAAALTAHWRAGTPVVAYNASFDLTLLEAELRRHALPPLTERLGGEAGPVVDPYTIDRAVDRYRKGRRTLEAVCREYGVELDAAHEAGADALAAVRVARAIAVRHARTARFAPWELHRAQVEWYAQWADGYQRWLRRQGGAGADAVVDPQWPVRRPGGRAATAPA
ncbi:exonuclease domain-containing protein [Streptomyces sp. NPDC049555]|uniref:exonuclease domain-containing protein n=1 Tax=Streptomyces sp. NPDC049555 TaxID=3154930 RepID=UPI003415962D